MHPIKIMINGLPGNVAALLVGHVQSGGRFDLLPFSLTGPEIENQNFVVDGFALELIRPDVRDRKIDRIIAKNGPFICLDFTHPSAVNANADFYCRNSLPFVMGTTGGDRKQLQQKVEESAIAAVIAPNMAKQVVGFQAMMEFAAETFPGLFSGYSATVQESHQTGKADTSGTAKAIVGTFGKLGIDFGEGDIQMERDPAVQREIWGIPEKYLPGHGWHTYTFESPDKTSLFSFTHNINGRDIYVDGTLNAVEYLAAKIESGAKGMVFSMIDVLRGA